MLTLSLSGGLQIYHCEGAWRTRQAKDFYYNGYLFIWSSITYVVSIRLWQEKHPSLWLKCALTLVSTQPFLEPVLLDRVLTIITYGNVYQDKVSRHPSGQRAGTFSLPQPVVCKRVRKIMSTFTKRWSIYVGGIIEAAPILPGVVVSSSSSDAIG